MPSPVPAPSPHSGPASAQPRSLLRFAEHDSADVLTELETGDRGLETTEAAARLASHGPNAVAAEKLKTWYAYLYQNIKDPLSLLLLILGVVSYFTGDLRTTVIIVVMLLMSVGFRFIQELRADAAVEKMKAMVRTTATVIRGGEKREISLRELVPGDLIELTAGDVVPADVRLLESRDLFINQATLTGESLPVEKHVPAVANWTDTEVELPNLCFMGTNVQSGIATAVVLATGAHTRFGSLAVNLEEQREVSSFDKGISRFTWLMIRFIGVMVPLVFFINGFGKGNWLEAFLFALAVAVGLTPELLPMIVTVNLSKGALDMAKRKVIVKRLNAIQNFGAMDILCTDKTGTLTEGKVALIKHMDIEGKDSETILEYAFLNSHYQTGFTNLIDDAILAFKNPGAEELAKRFSKVDEVPFDFQRRRMSVVVGNRNGQHILICKGAVEEILAQTTHVRLQGKAETLQQAHHDLKQDIVARYSAKGFRLIALAIRELPPTKSVYRIADETNLTLIGFLAFLDPPKESAGQAIAQLKRYGVTVKVLTGDNELVTRKICRDVGLTINRILLGREIETLSDTALEQAAEEATVFDKLEPEQKQRVIRALQRRGHVVGFLGDGINDAPGLKAADVGISVDNAADIAKESSDIILLKKSLLVLQEGVREGRRVFGNITKYIKMTASSNFGNMFSVVGGSLFLPFLPMLPLQIIVNNLLYDLSEAAIPTDHVDEEYLLKPRPWAIKQIERFILWLGPVSSLFDYATYALMLFVFHAWANPSLFQTGWFVESLLSQTLIIHVIRTKHLPFFKSRASLPLTITTILAVGVGVWLPFSPLAHTLGFVPLPGLYWVYLFAMLVAYFGLAQLVKGWFIRRYGWE